jgi:PAS domain S-box-containing protein
LQEAGFNPNKIFDRLSIRAKLVIAFGILGVGPLATFLLSGVLIGGRLLRENVRADLRADLEVARLRTLRSMSDIDAHVRYMSEYVAGPLLNEGRIGADQAGRLMAGFLMADSSALFRVQVLDAYGDVVLRADRDGWWEAPRRGERQLLYQLGIRELAQGERAFRPVELRGRGTDELIPAIAILSGIYDADGYLRGGVVGEALASTLFSALEDSEGSEDGWVSGLSDRSGLYLFHSERKSDWLSLMDPTARAELSADFSEAEAATILSGAPAVIRTQDGDLVAAEPVAIREGVEPQFFLFRSVPESLVFAPFRRLLLISTMASFTLLLIVSLAALVAAQQFTEPIYRLRSAARDLMARGTHEEVEISTNDEFEDLASDFNQMAQAIIAQRRRLEELLDDQKAKIRRQQAELAEILSNSADAIIGLDEEGRVRVWNQGAEALFGYSAEEAEGGLVRNLIGLEGPGGIREEEFIRRELMREGRLVNFRTERRHKSGELIPVTLTQTSLPGGTDGPGSASLIVRDTRLEASLEEQMGRSERLAAISVMAAGLAHEVNNPLGIIGNRIELMQRELRRGSGDGRGFQADLELLQTHVDRLRKLTRDLLRFARDDEQSPGLVSLDSIAERVVGLLERTVVAKNVFLELDLAQELPLVVGSEPAIETLLVNLVMNAADASDEGGRIHVQTRISVTGLSVELEVRDGAGGIPAELGSRIWEPFFTTKGERGGTGLGLAVCRSIMDRHNGRIWVEDTGEGGSRFVAAFPIPIAEQIA